MCSSGGMRWIASRLGWSFHEKWVCASTMPRHQERAGAVDHLRAGDRRERWP
jgi:hypothetical protein